MLNVNGSPSVGSTSVDQFTIKVQSVGAVSDFNPGQSYAWTLVDTTAGTTGFDATDFTPDTTGFAPATMGGRSPWRCRPAT